MLDCKDKRLCAMVMTAEVVRALALIIPGRACQYGESKAFLVVGIGALCRVIDNADSTG
jgi:hypothetical protein